MGLSDLDMARIAARRRGGDAALKGILFEELVVMVNLLDAAARWVAGDEKDDGGTIERQLCGPVDDVGFLSPSGFARFIQAKSGKEVYWVGDGLAADYEMFIRKYGKGGDAYMQVAVSDECETTSNLEAGVRPTTRGELEVYDFVDLPSRFWKSYRIKSGLGAVCVDSRLETLVAASLAVTAATAALLANRGWKRAAVSEVMALAKSVTPSCFRIRADGMGGPRTGIEVVSGLLVLTLELNGAVLTVIDLLGEQLPLVISSPAVLSSLLAWLSDARPTTLMEVDQFFGDVNGR